MKKITLFSVFAFCSCLAVAQSQRTELFEEFSSENSAASATSNPVLNTLLNSNKSKVAAITYLSTVPTGGTLSGQDRRDTRARQQYYAVPFSPYGRFNGGVIRNPLDTTQNGNVSLLLQNVIDTAYNVNSPFTITLSHKFHPAYDSVTVTMIITATQAYSSVGTLTAQIAMEEAAIHLSAPSGTNGEKDFYNVMRKMVPSATFTGPPGTTLPTTWTVGQIDTVKVTTAVPGYIYDNSQICFVGFIQDDGTLRVQQAASDLPQPIANDAAATALSGLSVLQCASNFISPVVTIKNTGTSVLTTISISYQLDATTAAVYPWTGTLAPGASVAVALPNQILTVGLHTFKAWPTYENGTADVNTASDMQTGTVTYQSPTGSTAPLFEGFEGTSFAPLGWTIVNPDNDITWAQTNRAGGFGNSGHSARIQFNRDPVGKVDYLYSTNVNLSSFPTASLTFSVAHSQWKTESDSLIVEVTADCGSTWTKVYAKGGAILATSPADTTGTYTPAAVTDWRWEVVNLNAFGGLNSVNVRFKAVSAMGNALYIDDVNISNDPAGIKENNLLNTLSIYPNPFSDNATIAFNLKQTETVKVSVCNILGQTVYMADQGAMQAGEHKILLSAANLSNGFYFVNLTAGSSTVSRKISINK